MFTIASSMFPLDLQKRGAIYTFHADKVQWVQHQLRGVQHPPPFPSLVETPWLAAEVLPWF